MATTTLHPAAPTYRSTLYEWVTTTDHKKIGVMYLINSFFFFFVGGPARPRRPLRARPAGPAVRDRPDLQRAVHDARHVHDLPVHHPDARGLRELHRAAPDRRARTWPSRGSTRCRCGCCRWPGSCCSSASSRAAPRRPAGRATPAGQDRPLAAVGPGQDLWIVALVLVGTSSILGAINFLVTIFKMRAPGMTLFRMPIMVWTMLVTSRPRSAGDAGPHERPDHAVHRPQLRRRVLRPARRRRRDPLPERVLVLLAPGGLHHDPAGDGHHQRDPAGLQPQAAVRLQGVRLRDGRHRRARASPCGPTTCSRPARCTCRSSA